MGKLKHHKKKTKGRRKIERACCGSPDGSLVIFLDCNYRAEHCCNLSLTVQGEFCLAEAHHKGPTVAEDDIRGGSLQEGQIRQEEEITDPTVTARNEKVREGRREWNDAGNLSFTV